VWWDRKSAAGQAFDEVIERELEAAKCVIVLWSQASIDSEWVKNEAADAAARGMLAPALLDRVQLPLEFQRRQAADLVGWDGDRPPAVDLADLAADVYHGDVVSDAKGGSVSGVALTISKLSPRKARVTFSKCSTACREATSPVS
jgi:hypothetical protein